MSDAPSPLAAAPDRGHAAAAHGEHPNEHHEEHHDEFHVHTYEHSGIAEGNARVPLWLIGAILLLFGFFAWYIATQWGAQPTSARLK